MNKNWLLIAGLLLIGATSVALGDSDVKSKFDAVVGVTQEAMQATQTTSKTALNTVFGWVPLVFFFVGAIGMAVKKYEEVKTQNKGTIMVLFWALVGAFAGSIAGFAIVYFIGLVTMGGSEALVASADYWK